ncbi:hypothetical protein Y1Q_0007494 [Alligator mississippiensis]|uniref:Uncharacterized protein n=1 Tax=Alligator mississippiensis TaxID=8496 RepID=A0A151M4Y9_ALLMI|nr:hypothetical protein Y1Q_0007494 [Alligator mississippiensis]
MCGRLTKQALRRNTQVFDLLAPTPGKIKCCLLGLCLPCTPPGTNPMSHSQSGTLLSRTRSLRRDFHTCSSV